jgi:hypothetical protein
MKTLNSRVKLLLPGLFGPMPDIFSSGVAVSVPTLERVLARADRGPVAGRDYLSTLYALFGHAESAEADLPEGAVRYLAEGGAVDQSCFMRADPVHLHPDRDRLLLFDSGHLAIRQEEAERIAAEFNRHFSEDGMQLLTPHPERWYLRLAQCPALRTASLSQVVGHHVESFLPTGQDARIWRQRLNEAQMLLFQSPVNRQREEAGSLTINAVWLSGSGKLPRLSAGASFEVMANELNALGLAQIAGLTITPMPGADADIWSADGTCLMVWMDLLAPVLHGDPFAWVEAMHAMEIRLQGLVEALRSRGQGCLELLPCNGEVFAVTPWMLRRFWRRSKKMPDYLV